MRQAEDSHRAFQTWSKMEQNGARHLSCRRWAEALHRTSGQLKMAAASAETLHPARRSGCELYQSRENCWDSPQSSPAHHLFQRACVLELGLTFSSESIPFLGFCTKLDLQLTEAKRTHIGRSTTTLELIGADCRQNAQSHHEFHLNYFSYHYFPYWMNVLIAM